MIAQFTVVFGINSTVNCAITYTNRPNKVERAEGVDVRCGDHEIGQFLRADLRSVGEDGHGGRVEFGSECLNGLCGVCLEDELRAFDGEVICPAADHFARSSIHPFDADQNTFDSHDTCVLKSYTDH